MRSLFHASGHVGRDLLAIDWTSSPLGDPQGWPQSLKNAVHIVLTSRFSMWMAWGQDLTFLFNETYRRTTLGAKYPWALARPAQEVWHEIWSDIGPRINRVMSTGVASWDESLMLFLERNGYREETYHTFSYSPLTDDDGAIAGMLCVVNEDTERVISDRHLALLRDLGADLTSVRTESDLWSVTEQRLTTCLDSLPFSLVYLFGDHDPMAHLACVAGAVRGDPIAPVQLSDDDRGDLWPTAQLLQGRTILVEDLGKRFDIVPSGAWPDPPQRALMVPMLSQIADLPYGFLVVGCNPYRPIDTAYEGFVSLIANQIAASIANTRAYDSERHRAETFAALDRAKTTFFTNVSHELRTPLTLVLGPVTDALADVDEPLSDRQRARIELVERNAERLLKLVNTLLDFSRLESGRAAARLEPVDLVGYTTELVDAFRDAACRAGLDLVIDCEPLQEKVLVDREMWANIVANLLSNALKFTFTGAITVRLTGNMTGAGPTVSLSVSDTGIGIDASEQQHLFERFHRVKGARSRTFEGSGIGLALVAELTSLHGGETSVRSEPGVGSTFVVTIPQGGSHLIGDILRPATADATAMDVTATDVTATGDNAPAGYDVSGYADEAMRWMELQDQQHERSRERAVGAVSGGGSRARILVVDDNADMRSYIMSLLRDRYDVTAVADGVVALDEARAGPPDCILTDIMMPNLDGFGLLEALRADPSTRDVPVIILSARAGEESAFDGIEAGADDYLTKPFSALELVARVRANLELDRRRREAGRDRELLDALQRSRQLLDQAQQLAHVGSWEFDVSTGVFTASDELARILGLTPAELSTFDLPMILSRFVPADDHARVAEQIASGRSGGAIHYEGSLIDAHGVEHICEVRGALHHSDDGTPVRLQGSIQDVTERRRTERTLAAAELARVSVRQEHRIAEELQRSLVPAHTFRSDNLQVATFYQAGERGTRVGGDWYDVIELGAGRSALIIGDVMGRGVRAAAVMGQLRSATRAFARLDLPPRDVLDFLDGTVRDLEGGQIVTCIYAVYDPADHKLEIANAGHPPPLLALPGEPTRRISGALGPPLGAGPSAYTSEQITLSAGATVVLYTDGLVERRGSDLDSGIDALGAAIDGAPHLVPDLASSIVRTLRPDGADDDVALLVAQVPVVPTSWASVGFDLPPELGSVARARLIVEEALSGWSVPEGVAGDVVLLASELVTNAIVHGMPPIELRLSRNPAQVILEVLDSADYRPRARQPTADDEHGRGLQIVELLADSWGTRRMPRGKSTWCISSIAPAKSSPLSGRRPQDA